MTSDYMNSQSERHHGAGSWGVRWALRWYRGRRHSQGLKVRGDPTAAQEAGALGWEDQAAQGAAWVQETPCLGGGTGLSVSLPEDHGP